MWRKKGRAGKQVGNWLAKVDGDEVNLGTKDAELATKHLREALEGRRDFRDEIDDAAAALPDESPPAPAAAPVPDPLPPAAAPAAPAAASPAAPAAPAALPPIPPADPQDFADTAAAAGEAAGAGPEKAGGDPGQRPDPEAVDEVTTAQLADLGVEAQVWVAAWQARRKVYAGFVPPPTQDQVRVPLAARWKTILEYAGAAAALPPWVTGVVIPAVTLVGSTFAMAHAFAGIAEEQRKAAGAPPIEHPTEAAA